MLLLRPTPLVPKASFACIFFFVSIHLKFGLNCNLWKCIRRVVIKCIGLFSISIVGQIEVHWFLNQMNDSMQLCPLTLNTPPSNDLNTDSHSLSCHFRSLVVMHDDVTTLSALLYSFKVSSWCIMFVISNMITMHVCITVVNKHADIILCVDVK